jgi:hypothetical protein
MRMVLVLVCLVACVHRVDVTHVALRDTSELTVEGSGAVPHSDGAYETGLADHDVLLVGRPSDVLSFDGDQLHMHLTRDEIHYCHHGQRCDRRVLDLRADTPLANVQSIQDVGVVASHRMIPLGLLTGTILTAFSGGMIAYELDEHEHISAGPAPFMLAFGITILAVEIHARLAQDTTTAITWH